jgi:CBS domain-containing protein
MLCEQLMKRNVKYLSEREPVHAAAKLMRDANVGFLPVCDDEGRAVGVITDRDIVIRLAADKKSLDTPVSEVMTKVLVTCRPSEKLGLAEARMREHHTSRTLCLDEQGKPVGVISLWDVHGRVGPIGRMLRGLTVREART